METLEIHLSQHAVERFHERVRPSLGIEAAEDELARLVAMGQVVTQPPPWHAERQRQTAPAYLVICDLVLPLVQMGGDPVVLVAVTCIARGGISDQARARRNSLPRAARRRGRRRSRANLANG
jgi:hypothetical protein